MMKIKNPLNNKQSLYLLWVTILNQSQNASVTLDKTLELFRRLELNIVSPKFLKQISYEKLLYAVSKKPAIHRFPKNMANNLYLSIQYLFEEYGGNPCMIFENLDNFDELKIRFMEFRGIGEHKSDVAIDIFKNFIKKDDFTINERNNCASLFFTLDKEIYILNSLREQK